MADASRTWPEHAFDRRTDEGAPDVSRGNVVVILLCGGDKSTQQSDIQKAKELAVELELE